MALNVGDIVYFRDDLEVDKEYGSTMFVKEMLPVKGKFLAISTINERGVFKVVAPELTHDYWFSPEMLVSDNRIDRGLAKSTKIMGTILNEFGLDGLPDGFEMTLPVGKSNITISKRREF